MIPTIGQIAMVLARVYVDDQDIGQAGQYAKR